MIKFEQPNCEKCRNKDNSLFQFCSCEELHNIEESKTCNLYKRGQIIFQEGGLPLHLFCLYSGSVKIIRQASGGKEQIVRLTTEGDLIGYLSLITHKRYTSTAIAAEDSNICIIPKAEFYQLLQANQRFKDGLVNLLCKITEDLENKMTGIAYKPVRGRIAEALILISHMTGNNNLINLTREDLASFVGTVKETAIRTLSEFKDEKLIEINKRNIKIIDLNGLTKVSNLYD